GQRPRLRRHGGGGGHRGGRPQRRLRLQPGARPPGPEVLRGEVRHRPLLRPHLLPQRHQHRLPYRGVRPGRPGDPGRRPGGRGLLYRRDHRYHPGQDLAGRALPRVHRRHHQERRPAQLPEGPGGGEMNYKIALIRGDGIGPEVVGEAVKVMEAVGKKFGHTFTYEDVLLGGCATDAVGKSYPDGTAEKCKACDAVLLGAVGGPKWGSDKPAEQRPETALLAIRKDLGLYANLRPAALRP